MEALFSSKTGTYSGVPFADGIFSPIERIMVVGDDVQIDFDNGGPARPLEAFTDRHARAFGDAATRLLRRPTVAVVGVSGTGSPLI